MSAHPRKFQTLEHGASPASQLIYYTFKAGWWTTKSNKPTKGKKKLFTTHNMVLSLSNSLSFAQIPSVKIGEKIAFSNYSSKSSLKHLQMIVQSRMQTNVCC